MITKGRDEVAGMLAWAIQEPACPATVVEVICEMLASYGLLRDGDGSQLRPVSAPVLNPYQHAFARVP